MNIYQYRDDANIGKRGQDDAAAAAAARAKRPLNLAVLGMGAATTAGTLIAVEVLRSYRIDMLLYFADYVIPIGAIGVGLVAGTGYGFGSWAMQSRLSRHALVALAGLHALAWVLLYLSAWLRWAAAQPHGGAQLGFCAWFDATTRGMAWQGEHGSAGQDFGAFGYLVRAGEVLGFVGGGLIIPLIMAAKPYCEGCQRYFTQRTLFALPAAAAQLSFVRQKTQDAADQPVKERLAAHLGSLRAALAAGDGAQLRQAIAGVAPATGPQRKVGAWVKVVRQRCPGCGVGFIDFMRSQGNQTRVLHRFPVSGDLLGAADEAASRLPQLRAAHREAAGGQREA